MTFLLDCAIKHSDNLYNDRIVGYSVNEQQLLYFSIEREAFSMNLQFENSRLANKNVLRLAIIVEGVPVFIEKEIYDDELLNTMFCDVANAEDIDEETKKHIFNSEFWFVEF